MKDWQFCGFRSIAEASNVTDKSGYIPHVATKALFFKDAASGKIWKTTDLDYKKKKRAAWLDSFRHAYLKPFTRKEVTIMLLVVHEDQYGNLSDFISDFKKKLSRRQIAVLGYVWARDVGEKHFERHAHLVMAIDRITGEKFRDMMKRKKSKGYNIELCNNVKGFRSYLRKKEIYGANKQRSFGKSNCFKQPSPKASETMRINAS
jgi:hypothetical protein